MGVGDMEKLLDFWVFFLSTTVLFICDLLRQIILSFEGCSGRSEDMSPVPALPILPRAGGFLPQTEYSYWYNTGSVVNNFKGVGYLRQLIWFERAR